MSRIPAMIIGGAPRSGTTFLCEVFAKNPGIFVAEPFIPEPKILLMPPPEGDTGILARYDKLFASAPANAILIEKGSYYLENAGARSRFARLLPQTKIVFVLREPVSRAYSNWVRSSKNGLETLGFAEALEEEGRRKDPFPPERDYVRPFDYITRSRYGSLVNAWIDALGGADRIAVVQFEQLLAEPGPRLAYLQAFAGAKPLPWNKIATGVVNSNETITEALDPKLVAALREKLAPEMRLLAGLTSIDISRWGF